MRTKLALFLLLLVASASWVTIGIIAKGCHRRSSSCGSSNKCGGRARFGGCYGGGAWFDPYCGYPYNGYGGWGGCWGGGCGLWPGVSFNFCSNPEPASCQTIIYRNDGNEFRDTNNDLFWNITNKTSDTITVKNKENAYIILAPNQSGTLSHLGSFTMYIDQTGKAPFEFTDMAHEITVRDNEVLLD